MTDDETRRLSSLRIENSERGLTITKSLAWTIITAMAVGGFWFGAQITTIKGDLDALNGVNSTATAARADIEARLRVVEFSDIATRRDLKAVTDSITEIKDAQREILDLLRNARY